ECIQENRILRKITPQCIEYNGGLFVALTEEDEAYASRFEVGAQQCGIEIEKLTPAAAVRLEPNLNPKILTAYTVPDGAFDPLRLALAFAASARHRGAQFFAYHEVKAFQFDGKGNATGLEIWDRTTGKVFQVGGELIVNATGAWAGMLLKDTPAAVEVTPTPGVMVAYDRRLINRAINRLTEPSDGDILIPQRRMVVIGTTSYEVDDPDYIPVEEDQVKQMFRDAVALVPAVASTQMRGAYMSARPLVGKGVSGRSLARTFKCFDHAESDGISGLVTITGGKATTCREMAEKTSDLVCKKLGINTECETRDRPLRSYRDYYQPAGGRS
ncbi:MAG: FAD-dependent oxidoreductase, partial [Anaerolineae bacterium]|nr:FAD-dependent oxidoreductase [Anaerolineae bacterium]